MVLPAVDFPPAERDESPPRSLRFDDRSSPCRLLDDFSFSDFSDLLSDLSLSALGAVAAVAAFVPPAGTAAASLGVAAAVGGVDALTVTAGGRSATAETTGAGAFGRSDTEDEAAAAVGVAVG